jgi:hypothetical protein
MWSNFIGGDLNDGYRRAAMRLLVDTTPLRVSRDFRRLWIGQAVSILGTTVTTAAVRRFARAAVRNSFISAPLRSGWTPASLWAADAARNAKNDYRSSAAI